MDVTQPAGEEPELWLVRHGQTQWSQTGRHTSTTDLPLTALGEQQARAIADRLSGVGFAQVLTSPRERARRTAALAGFADATPEEDLVEWGYGDYEGLTTAQIRTRVPGWTVWSAPCPGGESAAEVTRRLDRVVGAARRRGGRTLVFGHGHASRALAARWLGLEVGAGRLFTLETATLCVLGSERESPAVVKWNA